MNIVLVTATRKEIEPLLQYLTERIYLRKHQKVDIVTTGVGMMNTAYCLAKQFAQYRPTLAIQAGIAGTFHPIFAPGMVVSVKEDMIGDLGVMQNDQWLDLCDLGLAEPNTPPWKDKKLMNPHRNLLSKVQLESVRAITVNRISTQPEFIQGMKDKYMPVVESMEGAAFHYACLKENIPFIQFRGISNMVGERDKQKWKLGESIGALNSEIIKFLNQVTDPY
jgi:futalosine hydrolase